MTTMTKERISQWWEENQEALQEEVDELQENAINVTAELRLAVICETLHDFRSNLDEAIEAAQTLLTDLKEIKSRVTF